MEVIRRGTTPTVTITTRKKSESFAIGDLDLTELWITYSQDNTEVLTKTLSDVTVAGDTITYSLTQAETLSLHEGLCQVQLRFLDSDGKAGGSGKRNVWVASVSKGGVIEGSTVPRGQPGPAWLRHSGDCKKF